jgi:hypothetical protein
MLRTIVWFGAGGFFTSCFANAVRRIPALKKPSFHAAAIGIGVLIGYQAHVFESSAESRYKDMLKTHEGLPLYKYLLAETAIEEE